MPRTSTYKIFRIAAVAILFFLATAVYTQTVGVRPGVGLYEEAVGFEGLVEGRFNLPFFEDGPGTITASALLGYSYVSVDDASKNGVMLAAGSGYEIRFNPEEIYANPGLILGTEFSQFEGAELESEVAILLQPYVEAGYEFDFNISAGVQAGFKNLLYFGDEASSERSITLGPVVHYRF